MACRTRLRVWFALCSGCVSQWAVSQAGGGGVPPSARSSACVVQWRSSRGHLPCVRCMWRSAAAASAAAAYHVGPRASCSSPHVSGGSSDSRVFLGTTRRGMGSSSIAHARSSPRAGPACGTGMVVAVWSGPGTAPKAWPTLSSGIVTQACLWVRLAEPHTGRAHPRSADRSGEVGPRDASALAPRRDPLCRELYSTAPLSRGCGTSSAAAWWASAGVRNSTLHTGSRVLHEDCDGWAWRGRQGLQGLALAYGAARDRQSAAAWSYNA